MANYIPQLWHFFDQIDKNNNRVWFHEHKEEYDRLRDLWLQDLDALIAKMTEWEPRLKGQTARSCAYRFYRDIRFSTDKSPYKTYFSASISVHGRKAIAPGFYLHMGPHEMSGIYGGIWCPDSTMLRKLRQAIIDNIEEFEGIINEPELAKYFPDWVGSRLKTVPKGWDKNHPNADLLRLKDYGKFMSLDYDFFRRDDWTDIVSQRFSLLKPFNDFLDYSLEEEIFTL